MKVASRAGKGLTWGLGPRYGFVTPNPTVD